MISNVHRGEIWQYEFRNPDKRRPVLVISRAEVLRLIDSAMVAPITSTIRGIPSEVIVGIDVGLKQDSAINLDHVQTVKQSKLRRYIGSISRDQMRAVCEALAIATGCE